MTAETSRMAGGRARPPSAQSGRQADERPPAIRLLTAAEELFGERSYHRTTVADICARAGMATGSFYSYFGSKAEIFAAVVRAINTDLRRAMKAALEHTDGGQRASERASFRAYFDMLSQRPWIDRIVRESEFIDPGLFREYYEHLTRGYARGVRAAQMAREVDAQLRSRGHRVRLHRHRQLRRHALGRVDSRRPGPRGRSGRRARAPGPRAGPARPVREIPATT